LGKASFTGDPNPLLMKWRGHASALHMSKGEPSLNYLNITLVIKMNMTLR